MTGEDFYRIGRLPPYVFAEVNALKAECRADGMDIIDLGMGNPDLPPSPRIINKLSETAAKPNVHRYSVSRGIRSLRNAHVEYYKSRFGVTLDPDKEVIVTLGSKEGLANLAMAITSPGDVVLIPNPSYPLHPYGFIIAGGALYHIPIMYSGDFNPELYIKSLWKAVHQAVPKPIAMVVNFPSNPTAKVASSDLYKEIVDFAIKNDIWILSDIAYAEIYFSDNPPPSLLETPRAKEVAIEFSSMSKTFSMAGWRVGFAAGNEKLIAALARIKSYLDYGAFTPIQVAATFALNECWDYVEYARNVYRSRRDVLISSFSRAGWDLPVPEATMFTWCAIPECFRHLGSVDFTKLLVHEAQVAVSPGVGFGSCGEGYVRIGLVENEQRIRQAARNIKKMLADPDAVLTRYYERNGRG